MFAEDLTAFFDVASGFAVAATLGGVAVTGIFDNGFALAEVGPYGMASTAPAFALPSASVPGNVVGLTLDIASALYTVRACEPDGTGITRLLLEVAE